MSAFDLRVVKAAASDGRVELGGRKFKEKLLPYLGTYVEMYAFTKAVLLELKPGDYMKSTSYGDCVCDEYGIAITAETQERFSVEGLETWYVKFTLEEREDGQVVLMASLHEPEWPLARVGGTLSIRFERRTR